MDVKAALRIALQQKNMAYLLFNLSRMVKTSIEIPFLNVIGLD
jgi:hypothetical protein